MDVTTAISKTATEQEEVFVLVQLDDLKIHVLFFRGLNARVISSETTLCTVVKDKALLEACLTRRRVCLSHCLNVEHALYSNGILDLAHCLGRCMTCGIKISANVVIFGEVNVLIEHHFTKGIVDPTLFARIHRDDILLVQIYVDDIILGSTNQVFSNRFAKLMKDNFEMLMMGEMKFFLRLQVHQSPRGIFICQSQYTMDLLKKHGIEKNDSISMPMAIVKLDADLQGTQVDQTKYHSMIGGLMYLTASRPDIAFATFVLWYSKDSGFELIAYYNADHAGCNDDCKGTSGGI
ncbi:retrovirus-related pol polyprotein from transposon TNT 1-94 [Tanacetum coccineum]